MNVPYFDLSAQYAELGSEISAALERVCQNASFILGEEIARFEQAFASYCEVKHGVALNSGTSALHLALLSVGIGTGDEVITTQTLSSRPRRRLVTLGRHRCLRILIRPQPTSIRL